MPRVYTAEEFLAYLKDTPTRLAVATIDLTSTQAQTLLAEGKWSINEILAHLRACADVWGDSIMRILMEEYPTIRAVSPRTYIHETNYPEQDFHASLHAFTLQRAGLVRTLEKLPADDWSRTATIKAVGAPYERTVLNFVERLWTHERDHVRDIERMGAAMHNEG